MTTPITLKAKISASNVTFKMKVTDSNAVKKADVGASYTVISAPSYEGSYIFTPTEEEQTVHTAGTRLAENITINPIPSNYGRITWNGSVLTVS